MRQPILGQHFARWAWTFGHPIRQDQQPITGGKRGAKAFDRRAVNQPHRQPAGALLFNLPVSALDQRVGVARLRHAHRA